MRSEEWIHAGTLDRLKSEGPQIVKGGIVVMAYEDGAVALDNRCPHLGFPLHLGSLCDGILTCHWHHARFDVCSGGTLDPWADDALAHEVKVENGEVWVHSAPQRILNREKLHKRLQDGLEQNISIVIAKAVVGLIEAGVSEDEIVREGVLFGTSHSGGWSNGLTILAAMRNVLPKLDKQGRILALYHGLVHVARSVAGRAPRRLLGALPSTDTSLSRLADWYRNCVEVRDSQGAEKVLLTAIAAGMSANQLADMMLVAVTDHFYLDGGHTFDFHNKAFEMLDVIGPDAAESILASLTPLLRSPSRSEEQHHWQSPVDLVTPLKQVFEQLQSEEGSKKGTNSSQALPEAATVADEEHVGALFDEEVFVEQLLGDQPLVTIRQMADALLNGIEPARLARLITYAAAERIVRFHTQNDFGDWIAVLHTFTYAHAVHERLLRSKEPLLHRALFYGAVSIYHDRFLNVPRAPKQQANKSIDAPMEDLLSLLDRRQQVEEAASWVASYLESGRKVEPLLNTLGHCLLREDADFHSFQMYEAAIAEYDHWCSLIVDEPLADRAAQTMLIACTRYLAAHAPTAREMPHTARIAWRLHRGEKLFESE